MRTVILNAPAQSVADPIRLARLTRHLKARLLDFGPGGPELVSVNENAGLIQARFPNHEAAQILAKLSRHCGVHAALQEGLAQFCLQEDTRFEDLDYVWGCLFDLLV